MSTSSMHVAKTGLNAQQTRMQIIANNLANVSTNGFKRDRANFETLLYQVRRVAGDQVTADANLTSSFSVGTGARIVNTQKAMTQGSLVTTDNSLDLAIEGGGFFQVLLPDGRVGYTRNGAFSTNAEGVLTTSSGYVVQPEITIPDGASQINISRDGIISVLVAGANGAEAVGQLQMADFTNRAGLQPIGESFFVQTDTSGDPIVTAPQAEGMGRIIQGALEASNVNVVTELVSMIETQRAYEVSSKSITTVDEMLRFISQNL
jgi:flagellar basal-body rod protein FlgG